MTGAAGAAVATVAALTLLVLNPSSPRSLATQLESLGGRVTAGALEPTNPGVLSAIANPLGTEGEAAAPNTRRTVARPIPSWPSETNPGAVDPHPLHRSELGNQEQSLCGPRLLHPENLVDEQRRRCARNPKPPRHTLDAAARLAVDASAVDELDSTQLERGFGHP